MGASTRNWAGNQRCVPTAVHEPTSTEDVAAIVLQASEAGQRVKAIGGGHSFTDTAMTDGHLLSLDAMKQIIDGGRRRRHGAGRHRLYDLNSALFERGLALPNLGDIDDQSIAGATATATHGTGIGLGNIATTIVGLELVTGDGSVVRVDEQTMRSCCVSPGSASELWDLVTEVTLRCVPAFDLHADETIEPLVDVLDEFGE